MKHKLLFAIVAITTAFTFSGCLKKGEDDPSISFKSRKARVAGDWEVVSYKYTSTYNNPSNPTWNSSTTYTMNGSTYTDVSTNGGVTTNTNGTETWKWTFEKDGTYDNTHTTDGKTDTEKGTWNFTSGVGDLKNKSQITYYGQNYTYSGGSSSYTGNYVDGAYDLKELRNKKMVWYYKSTSTGSTSNSSDEVEIEFEAK
jgi:hypothetical protein